MTSLISRHAFMPPMPSAGHAPATRRRCSRFLALLLLPLLLAGCIYDEVLLHETELVFESTGMVRNTELIEGKLAAEILEDIAQDGPAGWDIFAGNIAELLRRDNVFDEYLSSSVTPLGEDYVRIEIAGRHRIDQAYLGNPITLSAAQLYRDGPEHWLVQILPSQQIDAPSPLCVTIEPGWAFADGTDAGLVTDSADRVCVDRNEASVLRRYVNIQLHRTGG